MNLYALDPHAVTALQGLGEHPWARTGNCEGLLKLTEVYTRLSQKPDKSAETRERAKSMAQGFEQDYQTCLDRRASKEVRQIIETQVPTPTPTPTPMPAPTPTPGMPPAQVTPGQPDNEAPLISPKRIAMVAGGVVVVGALIYFLMRKR